MEEGNFTVYQQDGGLPSWFLQPTPASAFLPSLHSSVFAAPQLGQCSLPTQVTLLSFLGLPAIDDPVWDGGGLLRTFISSWIHK